MNFKFSNQKRLTLILSIETSLVCKIVNLTFAICNILEYKAHKDTGELKCKYWELDSNEVYIQITLCKNKLIK